MIIAKGVRGPASYATGGFLVRFGEVQQIQVSSGRMAGVMIASSSNFTAKVVGASGNVVTIMVLTTSGTEVTNATDMSAQHFLVLADGY